MELQFDELLKRPTIFKDERKLDINYIPDELPYRNKELRALSEFFITILAKPNEISRKILVTGEIGTGKTATVTSFLEKLSDAAKNRDIPLKYVHVNCRKERTSYKVMIKIVRSINKNFPKRGYSPQDLLETINDHLNDYNFHILIVLDELNYLINNDNDMVYSLTRLNDDSYNALQRISIIGIVRDISCINNLDSSTLSTLERNVIKFEKYSRDQIFDILKYRAEISIKENALADELIEKIADMVSIKGDIRYGLNLLWKAGKIAENENLKTITAECVRLANQDMIPFSTLDILKDMSSQKLIFLLAIVQYLKHNKESSASFLEILKAYLLLCENIGMRPRSYSQLWNYLQEYKKERVISVTLQSKSIRGRKALIEIPDKSLLKLEELIRKTLNSKKIFGLF